VKAFFNRFEELCERFDGLAVRERLLLLGSVVAGFYLLWDTTLLLPIQNNKKQIQSDLIDVQNKIDQISTEKKIFDKVLSQDPDAALRREQLRMQGRLSQLDGQLNELSLYLISVDKLPEVIRNISESASGITLLGLQALPPEPIALNSDNAFALKSLGVAAKSFMSDQSSTSQSSDAVHRHAIRLKIEGQFFEVADFLKSLESLKWRFYWEGMDYRVIKFPVAQVNIELYTLSTQEAGWDR
jgi:MSHA biogenesis protein MshJ